MKKLSTQVASFVYALLAFASDGIAALLDSAISLESSDPSVLKVLNGNDGKFTVVVVGPGKATLTAYADADLTDGERLVRHEEEFLIIDTHHEADHLVGQVWDVVYKTDADAEGAADTVDTIDTGAVVNQEEQPGSEHELS